MQDRKKTKAQLIAELETLRQQLLEMEAAQNERQSPPAPAARASERMVAAERLLDSQAYFASIIDIASEAIISIDETQHIISFNQGAEKIFGFSAGEIIGQPLDILLPDRFVAIHRRHIDDFAESAVSTRWKKEHLEICGRRKNGAEFPAEASILQLEVEGQRIYTVVLRDVSEHKQAEERLRFLSLITEQVSDSVLTTNLDYEITWANQSFQDLYGYSCREVLGRTPDFLNAEPTSEQIQHDIYQTVSAGQVWKGEALNRRKDGSTFPCELLIFPLVDEQGNIFAHAGHQRDITERMRAEAAEERHRAALQQYADRLSVLHEIDQGILAARSPEDIAQAALGHIRQLVPCQRASVVLYDFEANQSLILAVDANGETRLPQGKRFSLDPAEGIAHMRQNRPYIVEDISALARPSWTDEQLLAEGVRSYTTMPLVARGELIGSFSLAVAKPGLLATDYVDIAREVADQLAIAIQQARLFEAEAQRRQEAEALRDTVAALNGTLNPAEVLERILDNVGRVVPHDAANIMLIESGVARIVGHRGYAERGLEEAILAVRFTVAGTLNLRQMTASGQPLAIPDTEAYPDWVDNPEIRWIRSYAGTPICLKGEVVGFLNLDSDRPGFFTAAHAQRLQAFADQAAVALENAHLHAETQRQARELAALNKASGAMTSSLELNTILEQAMAEVKSLLEAEGASVLLHDPASDELVFAAVADPDPEALLGTRLPLTAGIAGWVMRERRPVLVEDARRDPRFYNGIDAITGLSTRSMLAVPLICEEAVMGVVEVIHKDGGAFDPYDLELLEGLANSAALAIDRARLFEAEHRQREIAETLGQVARVVNSSLELSQVLDRVLLGLERVIPYDLAAIMLLEQDTLRVAAGRGFGAQETVVGQTLPLADLPFIRQVIRRRRPIIIPDTAREPDFLHFDTGSRPRRCVIINPLISREEVIGTLNVGSSTPHRYSDREAAIAFRFAQQTAVAIENARLYTAAKQRAEHLAVLRQLDQAITASLRIDDVYDAFAHHTRRLLSYDCMSIILREGDDLRVTHVAVKDGAGPPVGLTIPRRNSAAGWVIRQDRSLLRPNIAAEARFAEDEQIVARGIQSAMLIPLRAKGQAIGTWNIGSRLVEAFDPNDLAIAESMADQLAIAIENARLYEDLQGRMEALQETQAQLIHSEKMAALGRLVASIAHEINNPLQSVQSCLTLTREELEDGQRPEKLDRYVGIVESEIDRISAIVDRMRDFYLPVRQEWRPTGLHPVLESVLDLAGKQLQHSHISVERVWSDDLPPVQANADQLRQVFLNLVLNAIDAMPRGGRLHISTGLAWMAGDNGQQERPAIRLEFSDTGAGMSAETLSHLFEPFFTTKPGGSGLGLSISHGIIEAHQGLITVTSQVGLGTTFTILLPVAQPYPKGTT